MKLWETLRKLLPILAISGLVLGPMAAPAGMGAAPSQSMSMEMDGDMPCCPHEQPPPCDKNCPMMTLCMANCFYAVPSVISMLDLRVLGSQTAPVYKTRWHSRTERPPLPPPRS